MPVTRVRPIASVCLFNEDAGDPKISDHGFVWWDSPAQGFASGTCSVDGSGRTHLEYLEGIKGLTCRPFLALQNTRVADWTDRSSGTSGGGWQEVTPATGCPRVSRLQQYDTSPSVQYYARSNRVHPRDPQLAFSLILPDSPPDWDATALPPYVRVEWGMQGSGARRTGWAAQFDKSGGYLLRMAAGTWGVAMELPSPARGAGYADLDEMVVYVRTLRGRIGISLDYGRSYRWYGENDGDPIRVPASEITVRGQGGMIIFGLHQLQFFTGTYEAQPRNTFTRRLAPVPVITGRYDAPGAATVLFTDTSPAGTTLAGYRAALTPNDIPGFPFHWYQPPVLYSTTFRYPVQASLLSVLSTTPWDNRLLSVAVDKPIELEGGACEIILKRDPGSAWSGSYRDRKIQVRLGWRMSDASDQWTTVFTGYIREVNPAWPAFGETTVRILAENALSVFDGEWTPFDARALCEVNGAGTTTLNQAADYLLSTEGLDASYRAWDGLGDRWMVDAGRAEEPFELLRPGERKRETLRRLFGYAGLELAATDGGGFTSVPHYAVSSTVHPYRFKAGGTPERLPLGVTDPVDYRQSATAAIVTGRDWRTGQGMVAWAVDAAAEALPSSGRFTLRRRVFQEEIPDPTIPGILLSRCQDLAREGFLVKHEPELRALVNLDVLRRDQVQVYGAAEAGIPEGTLHVVLTLNHRYRVDEGSGEFTLETAAGLRRL